ncbi:MAG TPA: helix-turn-helix domain-containing protein [Streptosporangiaceae bacterium]|nr:helix-turn-helix domain-containing protein [Streptosporangiaceae bacterium]
MTDAHRPARSFGDVLRAHRDAAALTQEELAERAQFSVRAIADLERGRTARPRPDSVRRLAAALGLIEPALGQFHLAARGMPAAGSFSGESGGPDNRVAPRLLPAAVPAFAGRRPELAVLSRMLDQPGGMAVITAIGGTAGVGKTALAIYWSHQVAAEFPDGQLFVNLRGFDPSGTPVVPADAMPMLLEALGVAPDRIPGALDTQTGLYRSLLAGKRMLIVLDNANDEAQVRPLLPGSLTCRVVVTSRNQLTGLAAIEAARLLMLDVLTDTEAHELLQQRLGADRLSADPAAVAQIIRACAPAAGTEHHRGPRRGRARPVSHASGPGSCRVAGSRRVQRGPRPGCRCTHRAFLVLPAAGYRCCPSLPAGRPASRRGPGPLRARRPDGDDA